MHLWSHYSPSLITYTAIHVHVLCYVLHFCLCCTSRHRKDSKEHFICAVSRTMQVQYKITVSPCHALLCMHRSQLQAQYVVVHALMIRCMPSGILYLPGELLHNRPTETSWRAALFSGYILDRRNCLTELNAGGYAVVISMCEHKLFLYEVWNNIRSGSGLDWGISL